MKRLDPILKFLLIFGLSYLVLMLPFHGLQKSYASAFNSTGDALFGNFGSQGVVRFTFLDAEKTVTQINLGSRGEREIKLYEADKMRTRYVGYIYLALFISLLLASPVSWRRKGGAFLIGFGVLQLLTLLKVLVVITARYNFADVPYRIFNFSPFWTTFYNTLEDLLVSMLMPSLILTTLLWMLVTFKRQDLAQFKTHLSDLAQKARGRLQQDEA